VKVCAEPGCPELTTVTRCTEHTRAKDRARGTSTERGYDYAHQQDRAAWAPKVAASRVLCRRCRKPIRPDAEWDCGHPDADCPRPKAPEHLACNRATAGRAAS
jgi:hypothetical protein